MARPARLDPVRRPSRDTVWRLTLVAALLAIAAVLAWSGPGCG